VSRNSESARRRSSAALKKAEEAESGWAVYQAHAKAEEEKSARLRALRMERDARASEAPPAAAPAPRKRAAKRTA
jgi:hypothetical protein